MKVVESKIKMLDGTSKLKAFAEVAFSLDNSNDVHMVWNSLKIFDGANGLFVKMPDRQYEGKNPTYIYINWKTTPGKALQDEITACVLAKYNGETEVADVPAGQPQEMIDDDEIPF